MAHRDPDSQDSAGDSGNWATTRPLASAARDASRRGRKNGGAAWATPVLVIRYRSDGPDLVGLRALGAPAGGVLDPLVFLEAAVAVSLDGGVVDEDIGSAVVGGDETIALVGVEPLHCALSHYFSPETIFGAACAGPGLLRSPAPGGQAPGSAAPRSELRRRCDTDTNFHYNQDQ